MPDLDKLTAFTVQPRFIRVSPSGSTPLSWDLNPSTVAHRLARYVDDDGPYLRLTLGEGSKMTRLYRQEAIPDTTPVPLSIHAETRASGQGDQQLGLTERRPAGQAASYTVTAPANGAWTTLVLHVDATNGSGTPKEVFYARRNARSGDWFDVRRITVFVGIVP